MLHFFFFSFFAKFFLNLIVLSLCSKYVCGVKYYLNKYMFNKLFFLKCGKIL